MKLLKFTRPFLVLATLSFFVNSVQAQLVNCNVFLQGNYVEVGININGAFGSSQVAPGGYHARGGSAPNMQNTCTSSCGTGASCLGFVSDPDKDGWTIGSPAYFGDYFIPGSPQEGWSLEVNGVQSNAWNQNATCGAGSLFTGTLSGTNISYSNNGSQSKGIWQGINGDSLAITQVTEIDTGNVFFTVTVTLKNKSAFTRNNVYYMRTVDPDNEQTLTGSYSTINRVVYQLPDTLNATLVTATGTTYSRAFLGLGTLDCRAKCFFLNTGLSPTVNCDALYTGSGTVHYSGVDTADAGMGIVFSLGNIAPGDSVTFAYAYILNIADLAAAFKATLPNWTATGDTLPGVHAVGDTANVCVSAVTTVSITNPGDYTWTWESITGESLSTYTGPSTTVTTDTSIITLRAVGSGSCSGLPDTLFLNLAPTKPKPNTPTGGSNSPVCEGSPINFTASTTTAGSSFSWTGPLGYTSGLQNPTIPAAALGSAGVYTVHAVHIGCYSDTGATVSVIVNPLPAVISGSPAVCIGLTTTLSNATGTGTWSSTNTGVATINSSGLVTSVSVGTTTISYTIPTGCATTLTFTVNPLPNVITGTTTVCVASTTALGNTSPGGTWTSSNTAIATVGSNTGVVTGVAQGTATITYMLNTGCIRTASVLVNPIPAIITGASAVCVGSTTVLADGTLFGAWSSGNTAVATISFGGTVGGVTAGTSIISYTLGTGCRRTLTMTVNPLPAVITGTTTVCVGSITTLGDITGAGNWTSSNTGVATVIASTGDVTGVAQGSATITYTLATGCLRTASVLVNPIPAIITGTPTVCVGLTTSLGDATPAGAWSSSNTGVATVTGGGLVTGVSAGTTTISYTLLTGCNRTVVVTVNPLPVAISGTASVCVGLTTTLSDATGSGAWSSGNLGVATVTGGGVVTGVSSGTAAITYSLGTGCISTAVVTVNANPAAITPAGAIGICIGATTALADVSPGGVWSSSDITTATVTGSVTVTGAAAGTATISYTNAAGCAAVKTITVNITPVAIAPSSAAVCTGNTTPLTEAIGGGVWTSSNNAVATVGPTGSVTGVTAGTVTITYAIAACYATATVTVNLSPNAGSIFGPTTECAGAVMTLTDAAPGGVWSSSNTAIATVSALGVVGGVSGGTATISYSVTNSCGTVFAIYGVTILAFPTAGSISGLSMICAGTVTTLTDAVAGGVWSSRNSSASVTGTGLLTGVSPGVDTITYSVTNICGTATATKTITIGAYLTAGTISGASGVCAGSSITLTDPAPAGVWGRSNTNAAVSGTGVVTGATAGLDTISYTVSSACGSVSATKVITINPLPNAGTVTGPSTICIGSPIPYSDAASGGAWSVRNASATITGGGLVTPVSVGSNVISYSVTNGCGSAVATETITISPAITAGSISGPASVCAGSSVTLTDPVAGGAWSASNATATVAGGTVTGATGGIDTIYYTVSGSCGAVSADYTVTINPLPGAGSIAGPASVCTGFTAIYTDRVSGGAWSISNGRAAITGGGLVTGISTGMDTIIYTVTNSCGTAAASMIVVIGAPPGAGTISGAGTICAGTTVPLTETVAGGVWSSSNTAIATIGSSTGIVVGLAPGTANISYTISGCGTVVATAIVNVVTSPFPGAISGASDVCTGSAITVTDFVTGGAWSASNGHAAITSGGLVSGVTAGVDTIMYTITASCGTATAIKTITVSAYPAVTGISGPGSVCAGSAITLTNGAAGGLWSVSNTNATAGSVSGVVTGLSAGTDIVSYYITNACGTVGTTTTITINPMPDPGFITGAGSVCIGGALSLADVAPGGTWSAGNGNATVSGGLVTGITAGTDPISYTVANSCGTLSAIAIVTVLATPDAGVITGIPDVCLGSTTTLTDTVPGGTWLRSNTNASIIAPGIIAGVALGIDSVFYQVTNMCGTSVANIIVTINPIPFVGPVTGPTSHCAGTTITLTDATPGGNWSSSNPAVATAGSSSGIITGVSGGIATITYTVINSFGCGTGAVRNDTVSAAPFAGVITGAANICLGATTTFTDATGGGVWSSSNPSVAAIGAGTGIVNGLATGSAILSYSVSNGCGTAIATATLSVSASPVISSIAGPTGVCQGVSVTLSDATPGGIWSSSDATVAAVGSATGIVNGLLSGSAVISYMVTTTCGTAAVTATVTVNPLPDAGAITGAGNVCAGATIALADAAPGGVWNSSSSAIATVSATGVVTGVGSGVATISYTVTNSCGTATATATVTVNPLPDAGVVTGVSGVCVGSTIILTDVITGGAWSASNSNVTLVGGTVTGVSPGTDTIVYSVTNTCGTSTATKIISVIQVPTAGVISGLSDVCVGASVTLSATGATAGGTWSGSNTTAAVVAGVVTGMSPGVDTVSYIVINACGSVSATKIMTVGSAPDAGSVTGLSTVCAGESIALSNAVPGGVWSSSNLSIAAVSVGGVVTGISAGTANINYSVVNTCGANTATHPVTVLPASDCGTHANGIASPGPGNELKVYPNPNDGVFTISLSSGANEPVEVIITNVIGQRVEEFTMVTNKEVTVKMNEPAGVYLLTVTRQGSRYLAKVTVK